MNLAKKLSDRFGVPYEIIEVEAHIEQKPDDGGTVELVNVDHFTNLAILRKDGEDTTYHLVRPVPIAGKV